MKAIITVIGKDTVGILAKVSDACANANVNIVEVTQSVLQDMFAMIMLVEIDKASLGFDEIRSEYYLLSTDTHNEVSNPARTFGHKVLEKNGKQVHVICAVFKGTTTLQDCITDAKSVVDGFYDGGRNCADSLRNYIGSFEGASKDNTVLFITGHSLGAATANVVGRLSREFAKEESTFVYAFASPNYETEGEWNDGKSYPNFHYFTNIDDVVPTVPPRIPPYYFSKIGKEHLFNRGALDQNQKQKFERAYRYFRNMTFEEDRDLLGLGLTQKDHAGYRALKNHLCHTYMSFVLSELSDEEMGKYLQATHLHPSV